VHRGSYSSPQLTTLDHVPQVLLQSADGVVSVAPDTGAVLWEHAWGEGTPIVQPAVTEDGDVLIDSITGMGGVGIRRLAVSHTGGAWSAKERWTSTGLKPYFNDFVIHKGHAYGFDGSILSCIDLVDGTRKWKGGRYGSGQLVLLADEDVLLVVSEEGDLALVSATPAEFKELAKVPAIDGKTWNHPVLVGDTLLVRNGEVMAALKLTLRSGVAKR
jgi:outer membrane protein assembly factor BamB